MDTVDTPAPKTEKNERTSQIQLSVLVPIFNEVDNLELLLQRIHTVLDELARPAEIILVDDGSTDGSRDLLKHLAGERSDRVRVVFLDRNYGQNPALTAGFRCSLGDYVITLDGDLQNPPEEISRLVAEMDKGYDLVGAYRVGRQDLMWRKSISRLANRMRYWFTGIHMTDQGCMLRAYRRDLVDLIAEIGDPFVYISVLGQYYARNPAEIPVAHASRYAGVSKYNWTNLWRLNFDIITGFSLSPLFALTMLGSFTAFTGFVLGLGFLATWVFRLGDPAPDGQGLAMFGLIFMLFCMFGIIMAGIGILGEYMGRALVQSSRRPLYRIEEQFPKAPDPQKTPTGS